MRFFVGLHQPSDAAHVDAAFVSVNRLKTRKSDFKVGDWIMDSGAFSTILTHGGYPEPPSEYAAHIRRWSRCGNLLAAVAQDYMCAALSSRLVRELLHTADSMAWSFAARKQGRNANDVKEAIRFKSGIDERQPEHTLLSLMQTI